MGRPKGSRNRVTVEVRKRAQGLVEDPEYVKRLKKRLLSGRLTPPIETMLWHYAYGKPREEGDHIEPEQVMLLLRLLAQCIRQHVSDPTILERIETDFMTVVQTQNFLHARRLSGHREESESTATG